MTHMSPEGAPQEHNTSAGSPFSSVLSRFIIIACFYLIVFGNPFQKRVDHGNSNSQNDDLQGQNLTTHHRLNIPQGTLLDLHVIITDSEEKTSAVKELSKKQGLKWVIQGIEFGSWDPSNTREELIEFDTPSCLFSNGSLYSHIFVLKHQENLISHLEDDQDLWTIYRVYSLTKHFSPPENKTAKNLFGLNTTASSLKNSTTAWTKPSSSLPPMPFWNGNLTISLVNDFTVYKNSIPQPIASYFFFDQNGNYYPLLYINDFWQLREHYLPVDENLQRLTLRLRYEPISIAKFSFFEQFTQSLTWQSKLLGEGDDVFESVKQVLVDNPPWILVVTAVVSILHTILDILAFKSDVQFWKNKKSMRGLSLRGLYMEVISDIIILLYLIDNDTSWMILLSAFASTAIDFWKITKAVHIRLVPHPKYFYWISITEREGYTSTKAFDDQAMRYLYWALYPLVIAYSIYTLIYHEYKSWYSWVISSLAGFIYTFAFIMMTPQLFINYRLKSVAHLPWQVFCYKAINTFIDDLFVFIIRMPTMHRLQCFRDDIVFILYLYQKWIYKVDPNRIETAGAGIIDSSTDQAIQPPQGNVPIAVEDRKHQ